MLNVKSLYFNPCKLCISRLNVLNSVKSRRFILTAPSYVSDWKCVGQLQANSSQIDVHRRCLSTKYAANQGFPTPRKDSCTESDNVSQDGQTTPQIQRNKSELGVSWRRPEGLQTGIKVFNSLTRRKEPLILPNGRIMSWYQCGPTVYDNAHIGHASAYIRTDIIRRVLMNLFNIDVVLVMGITDIDDKIIKRAKELRYQNFIKMTQQFEASFFRDMDNLKILRPTVKTRVTEHMPHIIRFIQQIMENGYAYRTASGSVYFSVNEYPRYGRLWTHSMDTVIREPADKEKRSARDFALWKAAKPDEPHWESPWGCGRPGWHIECSTMASAIFGQYLDVHSGGDDLRFPHHENEMAQSEACFCNDQWTNYWIHTGSLHLKNDYAKMSKSLKNTLSVHELLKDFTPNQFRLFCMLRPYRNNIEYSSDAMQKAVRIHSNWSAFLNTAEMYIQGHLMCKPINEPFLSESLQAAKDNVEKALADDFDFPRAIVEMEELVHRTNVELNRRPTGESSIGPRSPGVIAGVVAYVERIMDMFGLEVSKRKMQSATNWNRNYQSAYAASHRQFGNVLDTVVQFRKEVRRFALDPEVSSDLSAGSAALSKDQRDARLKKMKPLLEACDDVRDDLKLAGVQIMDHGKESSWDIMEQSPVPEPSKRKT